MREELKRKSALSSDDVIKDTTLRVSMTSYDQNVSFDMCQTTTRDFTARTDTADSLLSHNEYHRSRCDESEDSSYLSTRGDTNGEGGTNLSQIFGTPGGRIGRAKPASLPPRARHDEYFWFRYDKAQGNSHISGRSPEEQYLIFDILLQYIIKWVTIKGNPNGESDIRDPFQLFGTQSEYRHEEKNLVLDGPPREFQSPPCGSSGSSDVINRLIYDVGVTSYRTIIPLLIYVRMSYHPMLS